MTLALAAIERVFRYNARDLPDPDPTMTPDEVKAFYAGIHGELTNAAVEGANSGGTAQVFTFVRAIGNKG